MIRAILCLSYNCTRLSPQSLNISAHSALSYPFPRTIPSHERHRRANPTRLLLPRQAPHTAPTQEPKQKTDIGDVELEDGEEGDEPEEEEGKEEGEENNEEEKG